MNAQENPFKEETADSRRAKLEIIKMKMICRYSLIAIFIVCVAAVISDYFKYNHQ